MMEYQHVPVTICFNKKDLITPKEQQELKAYTSRLAIECFYQHENR